MNGLLHRLALRPIARLCLSLGVILPFCVEAQVTTAEQDRTFYYDFLELGSKADVCSARLPGFAQQFNPLFARWRAHHAPRLRAGEALMRSEAADDSALMEARMRDATAEAIDMLDMFSVPALLKKCQPLLRRVASE